MLDDPSLPFGQRWALVDEIADTHRRFGDYRKLLKERDAWMGEERAEHFSLFEVGSGSGGLSRELRAWGERRGRALDLHLYDAQADVLNESLKKFSRDAAPQVHVATPDHLAVYPERSYDYIVSLHVIHHIQPFAVAVDALAQMLRVARRGIFIIDLENKPGAVPFARVWNRLHGVSADLSSDGIKSLYRSHDPRRLLAALRETDVACQYRIELKRYFFVPYWRLTARRIG
jgi:SAM-dependent methyltransferase